MKTIWNNFKVAFAMYSKNPDAAGRLGKKRT